MTKAATRLLQSLHHEQVKGASAGSCYTGMAAAITAAGFEVIVVAPDRKALDMICRSLDISIEKLDPTAVYHVALMNEKLIIRDKDIL